MLKSCKFNGRIRAADVLLIFNEIFSPVLVNEKPVVFDGACRKLNDSAVILPPSQVNAESNLHSSETICAVRKWQMFAYLSGQFPGEPGEHTITHN